MNMEKELIGRWEMEIWVRGSYSKQNEYETEN